MSQPRAVVLVVDDDLDIRNTVASILEDEGYQVVKAGNGQEALTYLSSGAPHPDLILLDMMMPVMDGRAFQQEQQKRPALAAIPVVTFTAFGAPTDVPWAAGRLAKPLRLETLLATVEKHTR
jgi:CheY-like chemotaxis protein